MYPYIFVSENLVIPSYFLVISFTYMVGSYWLVKRSLHRAMEPNVAINLSMIIMIGGFIGARLFHVFYEHPDYYQKDFLLVFKFWQGGFVFYGGLVGAAIPALFYLKKRKQEVGQWLDVLAPIFAFGYICGRFATLLSGSGYGRPTDLPWGIVYPNGPEAPAGISLHPTPIYSMLWNGLGLVAILWLEKLSQKPKILKKPGNLFFGYLIFHACGRLLVEQFRNDYRGGSWLSLSVSSWLSLGIILASLVILFRYKLRNT